MRNKIFLYLISFFGTVVLVASSVVFILIDRAEKKLIPITVSTTIDFIKADPILMDRIGTIKEYRFNHEAPIAESKRDTVIIDISGSKKSVCFKSYLERIEGSWIVQKLEYNPIED